MENMNFIDRNSKAGVIIVNGVTLDIFNLKPTDIEMSKLVRGLQGIIRFNSYSGYSVAQHSFMLSHIAEKVADTLLREYAKNGSDSEHKQYTELFFNHLGLGDITNNFYIYKNPDLLLSFISKYMAYDALLHDLAEAITGDVIRPMKQLIPEIRKIEEQVDNQIREYHCLMKDMPKLVDVLDKQIASIEAYYLTRYFQKTLLNETDEFHVKSFNSVFNEEKPEHHYVAKTCFGIDITTSNEYYTTPLTNQDLMNFIGYSQYDFHAIKDMKEENFLSVFVKRAVHLRNNLDALYKQIKGDLQLEHNTFAEFIANTYK